MGRMSKNDKGFSLVELIIVIAIISVIITAAVLSISLIFGANARTCANDVKSALAGNKIAAMGKNAAFLEIYRDAGNENIYCRQFQQNTDGTWRGGEPEKIGNARVYIAYCPDGGTETELGAGDSIYMAYDRSSGSFRDSGVMQKDDGTSVTIQFYSYIHVTGGRKDLMVKMTKLTGKVSIDAVP